ncbi:hypothetical protein QN277_014340 [Acacia crassicarpa]|uniref:Uncharacterized protein n=1 Tax=Acacia crassicarpa TaxID=499986 RepID=A0AAE1IM86_9FABA|nr:hypothetical protein QN277_014340 [Acacia crassicarpa]
MASLDPEIAKMQEERKKMEQQLASLTSLTFDTDLYGGSDKDAYLTSIPANEDEENLDAMDNEVARKLASYTAPKSLLKDMPGVGDADADVGFRKPQRIIDREDNYRQRRLNRIISPDRHDPFAAGEKTPNPSVRTYADVMREEALKREKEETLRAISKKKEEEDMPGVGDADADVGFRKPQRIIDREDNYRQRRLNRIISPDRHDPFAAGEKTLDPSVRMYADVKREEALKREKEETLKAISKKKKKEEEAAKAAPEKGKESDGAAAPKRRTL